MIKLVNESDMKYKTYKNAEKCFDILVNEKGYSREEAQDIIDHMLADYQYNPNSNQTLLSRVRQVLSKDEYEAEQEFARKNNPFKRESKYRKHGRRLREQDAEIEVKHEGILEVPDGKNVDDLPMSHFEKLAKKKGLGKITKALNNLQVWNKNDDPELSKWAGNMIDKLNKKLKKDESKISYNESSHKSYWKYDVDSPVLNRSDEDDTYLTKYEIKRVKLIPCENPDDCYDDDRYWAVCDYEYPYNEFYGTKDDAYDVLLTGINNSIFERIHDI